ncbi:hypothetical protein [Fodinicola acaciae]|uniref:hypothetical protein n=1 Tax=Fodinicola acaciae TaxID=2681555 RepID=UPI0013D74F73|nr:hypothetical protein [Fodinicola acaciae]
MTERKSSTLARRVYAALSNQLLDVLDDKDAVRARVGEGISLPTLAAQLHQLVQREAKICQQLGELRARDDDVPAAYVHWSWAAHLRQFDAQRYVEQLWLAQYETDALDEPS